MKTHLLRRTFAVVLWLGWFVLAGPYAGLSAKAAELSTAEILEAGIFTEETKGDVDAAMGLYQQVVADANASRTHAAQAQYRLGVCYHKKKDYAAATAAFEKVVREFPNEKELVKLASSYLAEAVPLQTPPWMDGEEMNFSVATPTGYKVGVARYSVEAGERDGRKTWRIGTHLFAGVEQWSRVEVEAESFKPISARWKHTMLGAATVNYAPGKAEVTNASAGTKTVELSGVVYENDSAIQLFRLLPLAPNASTSITVFVGFSGQSLPIKVVVTGPEKITVPAGTFDCHKFDLPALQQTFWYSTDAHRYLTKFSAGGVVCELTSVTRRSGEPTLITNSQHGFTVAAPAGWLTFERTKNAKTSEYILLDDAGNGTVRVKVQDPRDWKPEDRNSARAYAEHELGAYRKYVSEFTVREGSWVDTTVAGQPAVSLLVDGNQRGQAQVLCATFALVDGKGVEISTITGSESLDSIRSKVAAVAASYVSQPAAP